MFTRNFVLAILATTSLAQNDPLTTIAQALSSNGLTAFVSLLPTLNQSTVGQSLFRTLLAGGNYSLFVPNNQAISQVPQSILSDADALSNIVSYHVMQGNFTDTSGNLQSQALPNVTIGRSLLNDSSLVQLEGNRSQVLVWGKEPNGQVRLLNQPSNTTVQNVTSIRGFSIYTIDAVITPPPSFSQALAAGNAASPGLSTEGLIALLNNTSIPGPDGNNVTFTNYLDNSVKGFTFFAPNNAALQAAQSTLASLQGNVTAFRVVLGNHIINGSTLYSTTLTNSTSSSGEPLTFLSNSSGTFVYSDNVAVAKIVTTNVLAKNGVVHVIDRILANTQSNPAAASSAFNQATSTAALTFTETGPVSTPTTTNGGGNANRGSGNGAPQIIKDALFSSMLMVVSTIVCAAFIM